MKKIEISELSPEEKIRFEGFKNVWREGAGFYWKVVVLLLFWPLIDMIITINAWGDHCFGPFPNIPFFPLWENVCVLFLAVGFMFSWMAIKRKKKKWVTALIIIIWAVYFTYQMAAHDWIKDTLFRQIIASAEFLGFLGITVFLALKVKWPRFIYVVVAYLGILLILYYNFYIPLCPPDKIPHPHNIPVVVPVLGIISGIYMVWVSSEKGRRRAALGDILEERKKAKRKKKI